MAGFEGREEVYSLALVVDSLSLVLEDSSYQILTPTVRFLSPSPRGIGLRGELGVEVYSSGCQLFNNRGAFIRNLDPLQCLEPFKKFVVGGGGGKIP